ncbi:MAG: type II toxin-antitoxin system Phd/YefM family antitoxin [Panacagrimonas sp.]
MKMFNIQKARRQLSTLIRAAEDGEEVIIARANKPAVRLIPLRSDTHPRRLGEAKGLVKIAEDFDSLPEGYLATFE